MISFSALGRYGKLGNQMFQYAALIALSKDLGVDCCAPLSGSEVFGCFDLKEAEDKTPEKVDQIYREIEFSYNGNAVNIIGSQYNTDIVGYFQSEKYFAHHKDLVKKEFTFRDAPETEIDPEGMVSIHIRRGDYLGLSEVHPVQNKDYYRHAMDMFPGREFLIFSDDIGWCESADIFFGGNKKGYHFSKNDQFTDLYLMSRCTGGHIIANSSFSWWGAWLGGGETVAPKQWFGKKGPQNWSDVYCEGWKVV